MKKNLLLISVVVILAVFPLFIQKGAEFGGADNKAQDAISDINSSYKPWFSNIWTPPSKEIESLLFSLKQRLALDLLAILLAIHAEKAN